MGLVRKASDSLDRSALLEALRHRLGDSVEYRCLHALLVNVEAVVQTGWGCSRVRMNGGIKQGAIESPMLFSFIMELALAQASHRHAWHALPHLYQDLKHEDRLFMDDGYLWAPDCSTLGLRLEHLAAELRVYGLELNFLKCVLYCSPFCPLTHKLQVQGVVLQASDYMPVVGLKMKVGMSMSELIQPLLSRARSKFWGIKHLLRSHTPAKGRVRLMHRILTNTALWCIAALPPDKPALTLINSFQAMLLTWLLRLGIAR
eukprot:s911_g5.t1